MTTPTTVLVQLKVRSDTAANWTSANPTLLANELGRETDTGKIKIGTGSTAWTALPYQPFGALITNADISATAEIAVSKLADGAARQLLQTDAAGTGVEWTSNVDIPGTLDVTGTATFDGAVTVAGDLTVNGTTTTIDTQTLLVEDKNIEMGVVATPTDVTADGGGITLRGTTNKTINWVDATDAWTSSERFSVPLGSGGAPSLTFTGDPNTGIYSPGADQVAISTGGSGRLFVDASGNVGVGTGGTQGTKLHAVGGNVWSGNFYEVGRFQKSSGTAISLGYDNSDYVATVGAYSHDGTPSNLSFWTYSGSGTVQERLRITSAGLVGVGTSSPNANYRLDTAGAILSSGSSSEIAIANRTTNAAAWAFYSQSGEFNIYDWAAGQRRLVIDSSGNVGIGTTSPGVLLDLSSATAASRLTSTTGTNPSYVNFVNTAGNAYIGIESSTGGGAAVGNAPYALHLSHQGAYPINFSTNNALRATIDSSGRLLVGTSSSSAEAKFIVQGGATAAGGGVNIQRNATTASAGSSIGFIGFTNSANNVGAFISADGDGTWSAGTSHPTRLVFSVTADGASSPTERMRISNGGGILTYGTTQTLFDIRTNSSAGTTNQFFSCAYGASGVAVGGTESFRVFTNGNVQNTNNSYTAISDIKLKENIVDAGSQWADLKALRVRNYNLKEGQTHRQIGLIAQEVEPISPGLVYESPDRDAEGNDLGTVTKSVNYSVLYMKSVKALQEAMERIEQLETEMTAVKAQLS